MTLSAALFPLLAQAVESSFEVIGILDNKLVFVYVNAAFERATGYGEKEAIGKGLVEFVSEEIHDPEFYCQIEQVLGTGKVWRGAMSCVTDGGTLLTQDTVITPVRKEDGLVHQYLMTGRPLGERGESPIQLKWADQLSLAGHLAVGVSHQVNNSLSYIFANVAFITEELGTLAPRLDAFLADEVGTALVDIRNGATRIRDTVRYLSAFSGGGNDSAKALKVEHALDGAIDLVRGDLHGKARLVCSYRDAPPTWAQPSQLLQVFFHVLLNASQGFASKSIESNEIHVSTRTNEEGNIVVEVEDNGTGISDKELPHVFDLLYSRGGTGGSGLKLAITRGIVEGIGGSIEIACSSGGGTVCTVTLLPASEEQLAVS